MRTAPIAIRPLAASDGPALAVIISEIYGRKAAEDFLLEIGTAAAPWGPVFLVAEKDGAVVGCAGYIADWSAWGAYTISWVRVKKSEQRRGIGKLLVSACIERISAIGGMVFLGTTIPDYYRKHWRFRVLLKFSSAGYDDSVHHLMFLPICAAAPTEPVGERGTRANPSADVDPDRVFASSPPDDVRSALEPFLKYLKELREHYPESTPDTIIVGGPYNLTYAHFEKLATAFSSTPAGGLTGDVARLRRALQEAAADLVGCCKDPDDPFVAQALRRIADARALSPSDAVAAVDALPDYEAAARALGYQQIQNGKWFHPNQHQNFAERFKTAEDIFDKFFGKHWLAAPPVRDRESIKSAVRDILIRHQGNALAPLVEDIVAVLSLPSAPGHSDG